MKISWVQTYIEFVIKHGKPLAVLPKGYGVYVFLDLE